MGFMDQTKHFGFGGIDLNLVGGFSPTHLKKYAQVKMGDFIFPNFG